MRAGDSVQPDAPRPDAGRSSGTLEGAGAEVDINSGMIFTREPSPPAVAVAGRSITISGEVLFDCILCELGVERDARVVVETSNGDREIASLGKMGNGERNTFSVAVPTPTTAGERMTVTARSQRNPPGPSGWQTDDVSGPHAINIVTEEEKQRAEQRLLVQKYAPFALVGGGAGYAYSRTSDAPQLYATAGGAATGVAARWAAEQVQVPTVTFPWKETAAVAALLASAGYLASQTTGALADVVD